MAKLASTVRDALYYTHPESGCSLDQGYGVVVGVTAMLMGERGLLFKDAFEIVVLNLPKGYRVNCIPDVWQEEL